jgi:hypothetical protein
MGELPASKTGLRMRAMRRTAVAATATVAVVSLGLWLPVQAVAQSNDGATPKRAQAPARVRVHPLPQSFPGPNAVRECTAWIAPEYRPSGTVIVPKMHCWWERG